MSAKLKTVMVGIVPAIAPDDLSATIAAKNCQKIMTPTERKKMKQTRERLTVEVPAGWKAQLAKIAEDMERNTSYLTRKALEQAHPELKAKK